MAAARASAADLKRCSGGGRAFREVGRTTGIGRAQVKNSGLVMAAEAGYDGGYGGLVWRIGLRWRTGNQLHTQVVAAVAQRTVLATDNRLKWWRKYHLYIEVVLMAAAAAVVVWRKVLAMDGRLKWWRECRLYIEVVSAVVVAVMVAVWPAVLAWDRECDLCVGAVTAAAAVWVRVGQRCYCALGEELAVLPSDAKTARCRHRVRQGQQALSLDSWF